MKLSQTTPPPVGAFPVYTTPPYPIEYTNHVIVGANPDTAHGGWDTEHEAAWFFAKHIEEVLKDAQGKLLFVRRAPVLESKQLFDREKPIYVMIGRFSIGQPKEKNT
jgi:hypothetical protein